MFRRGTFCVWQRNFLYFRYNWLVSVLWVVFEPLLFLYAIGYGLGNYVGEIQGVSYAEFFFPALMVASGMIVAVFESTYSTYTKLTRQQTFHAILLSPVMPRDVAYGEIWWAATKGFLSCLGVTVAASLQGLVTTWMVVPALLIAFGVVWIFAAFGLLVTTSARNYDWFIYAQTGIVMPLYFFSGTYFPVDHMPWILQKLVLLSPLYHGVHAVRMTLASDMDWILILHIAVVLIFAAGLTKLSVDKMERKLIV